MRVQTRNNQACTLETHVITLQMGIVCTRDIVVVSNYGEQSELVIFCG